MGYLKYTKITKIINDSRNLYGQRETKKYLFKDKAEKLHI